MAMYPEGSLNAELVKRYWEILARSGIELKLDPSTGAVESVGDLRNPKSGPSVALVPGGITNQQESPDLVSWGTLFYQPLWIFSRRHIPHGHHRLKGWIGDKSRPVERPDIYGPVQPATTNVNLRLKS